jgi:transketolase
MTTANLVKVLPDLDALDLNLKIVACISPQLFRLQDQAYRDRICSEVDRLDGMAVTNRAYKLMHDFVIGPIGETYSLSSDWDHRWRTGGTVEEVIDEAHLGPQHIIDGITRYARDRDERHARLRSLAATLDADA